MKKIVSILVAMLMLLTMVPAFAAIEVDTTSPSSLYFNDFAGKADFSGDSKLPEGATAIDTQNLNGVGLGANKDHPINYELTGEKFTFSRFADSKTSGLAYVYYKKVFSGNFSFGFDITFNDFTTTSPLPEGFSTVSVYSVTPGVEGTVFQDNAQAKIDSGEWVVGTTNTNKAYAADDTEQTTAKDSKTAWCFNKKYADGTASPALGFHSKFVKVEEETPEEGGEVLEPLAEGEEEPVAPTLQQVKDENGNIAIFHGDVELKQGETYTYKVNVNTVDHTYSTIIIDSEGNIYNGVSGETQNAFFALYQLDTSIGAGCDGSVTIDNLFVENYFGIFIEPSWQANAEGTITFGATIPVNLEEPKVYINDTFVENLTLTPGEIDYTITSLLPEGTGYGEAVIEIRGKIAGEDVKASAVTDITSSFATGKVKVIDTPNASDAKKGLRAFASGGTLGTAADDAGNADGVWTVTKTGQLDLVNMSDDPMKGIVDYSFDFKTATNLNSIRIRMTANTGNGAGYKWSKGSTDAYHYFLNGYASRGLGTKKIEYKLNDWNTFKIRSDFYANKYYAYINGTLCEEGTLYAEAGVTDQIVDVRMIIGYSGEGADTSVVYLDNFKFEEFGILTAPANVKFDYTNGTSVDYVDEALSSVALSNIVINTNIPFDAESITDETAKVVNADGEKVNTSLSYADGVFTAAFGDVILPNGDYKLVISKAATVVGNAIGLDREIPFSVKSDDCIIAPLADENVAGATTLKVYAPYADSVNFVVNDTTVAAVASSDAENGIYTYEYTPAAIGVQVFDAYIFENGEVKLLTTNFNYLLEKQILTRTIDMNAGSGMSTADTAKGQFVDGLGLDGSKVYEVTSLIGSYKEDGETVITNTSNSNTSSFTPGNNAADCYRRMVTEFEIMADVNSAVSLEIGVKADGLPYSKATEAAYPNLTTLPGCGSYPLFAGSNGIFGSGIPYTPNTWYKFRQVIDWDNLVAVGTVFDADGVVVATKTVDLTNIMPSSVEKDYPDWRDKVVTVNKYKVSVQPIDKTIVPPTEANPTGTPARMWLDNFNRYRLVSLPAASTVNGANSMIIAEGTNEAVVALTAAYDSDTFNADLIAVKVNGEDFEAATVEVTDGANFKVSGLAAVKAGSKIEIVVSDLAYYSGAKTDIELVIPLYVANNAGLCVFPFASFVSGSELNAYAKYINDSDAVSSYLIITQYNGNKVAATRFASNEIEAGSTGVISGVLPAYNAAAESTIRLWNKADNAPLAPVTLVPVANID